MLVISSNFYLSHAIYFVLFTIICPIYLFITICLIILRKSRHFKTTFYELLLQQSIADILAISFYSIQKVVASCWPRFLYENQQLPFAPVFYNGIWWFIVIRSHGITILTLQRYLVIVKHSHRFTQSIQESKPWILNTFFWVPAILFNLVVFSDTNIRFEGLERLITVVNHDVTDRNTKVTIFFLSVSCVICTFCYLSIGYYLLIKTKSQSVSKLVWRELRLALQVLLLLVALIVLLVFMVLLNIFANDENDEALLYTRGFTPLVNGLLSFIGPFTIVFCNHDLSHQIKKIAFCQHSKGGHTHTEASVGTMNLPQWMIRLRAVRVFAQQAHPDGTPERI